jgi:hypothetical protein
MERRGEPRFYVGSKARILLPDNPQREIPAHVINVSASGLRVMISQELSLGQRIVVDLPHHVVAAEVCNRDAAGEKFAVGVRRLHEVSKLDGSRSAGEQVVGLMLLMGWLEAPVPHGIASREVAEPDTLELPVVVEPAPAAIELGEGVGLAAVAMELPKAAEPKPAVIEWQVVESAAPAIEFPKAPEPEPAPIEVTVEPLTASEPALRPLAPPPLHTHAAPVHAVETRAVNKGLPAWVAVGVGLVLALVVVAILARTNPDARASVPAKPEEHPAPVTPVSSTAPQPNTPTATPQPATSNLHAFAITAREPAWLEIAIDGKTVFQKMVAAGETKQMEFSRVAYLHIGNSAKVDVTLDSQPVARPAPTGALRLLELTASGARDLPWRNGGPILANRPGGGSTPQ